MSNLSIIPELVSETGQSYPIMIEAQYGSGQSIIDVTSIIRQHTTHDLFVSNAVFTDPCAGVLKDLIVVLTDGSKQVFPEHSRIDTYSFQYAHQHVVSAMYGWGSHIIDVTMLVRQQRAPFCVSNGIFTDPYVGQVKSLLVSFEYGVHGYMEGSVVDPCTWSSSTPFIIDTLG
jgi:hypothetical protein